MNYFNQLILNKFYLFIDSQEQLYYSDCVIFVVNTSDSMKEI